MINSSLILNTKIVSADSSAEFCKKSLPKDFPQHCLDQGYVCYWGISESCYHCYKNCEYLCHNELLRIERTKKVISCAGRFTFSFDANRDPSKWCICNYNQVTRNKLCDWIKGMKEYVPNQITVNTNPPKLVNIDVAFNTEMDSKSRESKSFEYVTGKWIMEDSIRGEIMRKFYTGTQNPYTTDSPKTQEFFEKVDAIEGSNEVDTTKQVYETVTDAVPGYGIVEDQPLGHQGTFEEMLITEAGVCRDKSALLASSLKRKGIEAEIISGTEHMWVRVTFKEGNLAGKQIDLDPTYYQEFFPIPIRTELPDPEYCS